MNINTRKLCMYKCIFNLTLKHILDLTRLFKLLGKIWFIYYLYHNDVIAMKNDAKVSYCISLC